MENEVTRFTRSSVPSPRLGTLEKIIKKSKNFLGAALLGFASFYSCENPANSEISKPRTEITKPEISKPAETEKAILYFENGEGIKTYAFGNHGWQRAQHTNPNSYYNFNDRYPDQKENVEINLEGNLTKQEKIICWTNL